MFPLFLLSSHVGALTTTKQNTGHAIGMPSPEVQSQFCDRNENIHNSQLLPAVTFYVNFATVC